LLKKQKVQVRKEDRKSKYLDIFIIDVTDEYQTYNFWNMKKSELRQIIREELLKEYYDPSLLGPQIIGAATDYAKSKGKSNREFDILKNAFIAGILWKTKH
jgi:hypothetical protein